MDPIALASASGFVETHALGSSVHTPTARRPPRSSWNPLPALPRLDDEVDADKIVLAASFHSLWLPSGSLRQSTSSALHGASASPPHAGLPAIPAAFSPSQLCLFAIDTGRHNVNICLNF
ncbi:Os12g0551400 [Oryza sativa Japonica Group]|uniref:Os12g0551400 protein n=1 Tax=Oryza sativa subsp. japonica TaxID=39947 RepID=A0A0N7KU67_ORYSJ|nr:Os12g0551400 [Oryza sativa Japonica Group]